jgi:hypothetical protein
MGKAESLLAIADIVDRCHFTNAEAGEALNRLLIVLDEIASRAKKIGDAQRAYFQLAFRELLNDETDAFQNLSACWLSAQEKYEMLFGTE